MSGIAKKKAMCRKVPLFSWREFSAIETQEVLIELTSNPVKLRDFRQRVASSSIPVNMMPNGVVAPGTARQEPLPTADEEVVS
jgi:hypothetical protein